MILETIVTTIGLAKIAAALANNSTVNLSEIALGDGAGNPVTPDQNATALVREVWRGGLTNLTNDPNNPDRYVVAETVVPTDVGGWSVREVGVYDNTGALIAIGNFPDTYKPLPTEGAARDLIVRIYLAVSNTSAVEIKIDPAIVLASRQWVTDHFGISTQIPGGNTGYVLRKKSNADGDFEWVDLSSGTTILVAPREEVQTLTAGQTVVNLAHCTTEGVALYINGIRLRGPAVSDPQYTITGTTTLTLSAPATAGQKLHAAQNEPSSELDFLRATNNLSEIKAAGATAQQKAKANLDLPITTAELAKAVGNLLMPVGHIYATVNNTNPATLLGFGTWARWGEGRALTGFSTSDSDFNAVEKTGGAKSTNLTTAQLPAHTHNNAAQTLTTTNAGAHTHSTNTATATTSSAGAHTHTTTPKDVSTDSSGAHTHLTNTATATTSSTGSHSHDLWIVGGTKTGGDVEGFDRNTSSDNHVGIAGQGTTDSGWDRKYAGVNANDDVLVKPAGSHTHTVTIPALTAASAGNHTHTISIPSLSTNSTGAHTHTITIPSLTAASAGAHTHTVTVEAKPTTSVGNGAAVGLLQPYIVAHLWKRTA